MKRNIFKNSKLIRFFIKETPQKYAVVFGIMLAVSLLCEFFVFNFQWIDSMYSTPIDITPELVGYTNNGATSSTKSIIMFENVNAPVRYLYFAPFDNKARKADITISATDDANANYLAAPKRTVIASVRETQYIRLNFSGRIKTLRIALSGIDASTVDLDGVRLNVKVPLMFSWVRFILFFLILSFIYILRPRSAIYRIKTNLASKRQRIAAAAVWLVLSGAYIGMATFNHAALQWWKDNDNHRQYYNVIDALKEGKLSFADGSASLDALHNPYDYGERLNQKVDFMWDNAYYNGKYYSYFGVAPAILLYLPYNLITGQDLPNYIALFIFGIFVILGVMLLLWEIVKKWYPNTPFAIYLLLSAVIPFASALGYAAYKPDFYMVPPMAALMFTLFGLTLWLSADKDGELSARRLALGSLCVALTAACRPQFLITIAFGVILYWDQVFRHRRLFSKTSIKETAALCVPFIVIGAAVMWYNWVRFDSPFDFGANYNLTSNDMTHRGFNLGRTGLGIFTYFFQPTKIDAVFPFLHDFKCETTYQGLTLAENLLGGVFMLYPLTMACVYGCFGSSRIFGDADKRQHRIVIAATLLSIVVAVVDAQMAGLLTRYFTDYVWMMMLGAALSIFAVYEKKRGDRISRRYTIAVVTTLAYVTMTLTLLAIFAQSDHGIAASNPYIYYKVYHMISFWN